MDIRAFYLICCFLIIFVSGCTTSQVNLISNTPAQVMLGSGQSDSAKPLGKTPLSLNLKELASEGEFLRFSFQAEEYESLDVIIPKSYSHGQLEVQLNKKEKYTPLEYREQVKKETDKTYKKAYKEILTEVLRIQSALMKRDFSLAKSLIANLDQNLVHDSIFYLIQGHLALMEGRSPTALANYEKALEKDLQSPELVTMVNRLKKRVKDQKGGGR